MRLDASPWTDPLWGWRWMARWYAGAALFGAFAFTVFAGPELGGASLLGGAWEGRNGPPDRAFLLDSRDAPRVDPVSGLVVLPAPAGMSPGRREFNEGVRLRLAAGERAAPRFHDRTLAPERIVAAFNREGGADVGDGATEFAAGDAHVVVERYDTVGCGFDVAYELVVGTAKVAVDARRVRVRSADGARRRPLTFGRPASWFPHARSMRVLVGDEGRTLWCRVTDVDGGRWIVSVDLVTGTTLQIDADPGG